MRTDTLIAVLAMAAVTWGCRAGGLLLAGRLPQQGRVAQALQHMPGCVMASLVAPAVLSGGPPEWVAAAATAATMLASRSLPLAMAAGIAVVALGRWGAL
ncbi:AzlD domain-containing protein [Schlegelella sp. S2-27]|uniref:AzlD domain-containing protein n=1 Tax=Caldimonas mangrovi TaxID=2944811 RepID=A0ABT0YSW6_9BURK|nr:AzlD domain-containing protein [Caldimonas mangrovi]MCM5681821.1 AzlD domain-containing protein [Caldimonas mangrovi]